MRIFGIFFSFLLLLLPPSLDTDKNVAAPLALLEVLVAARGLDGEVVLGGGALAAAALRHPVLLLGLLSVQALRGPK